MSSKPPIAASKGNRAHDVDRQRELPGRSPLELTEVYTLLLHNEARSAVAHRLQYYGVMNKNREQWGHINGPEWLEPHLELIAAGKSWCFLPETSEKKRSYTQHCFAEAQSWLAKKGLTAETALARVRREIELHTQAVMQTGHLHENFLHLLQIMGVEQQATLLGKRVTRKERSQRHFPIDWAFFARPIEFNPFENELSPKDGTKGRQSADDFDPYPYYCEVLMAHSHASELKRRFPFADLPEALVSDPMKGSGNASAAILSEAVQPKKLSPQFAKIQEAVEAERKDGGRIEGLAPGERYQVICERLEKLGHRRVPNIRTVRKYFNEGPGKTDKCG